MSKIRKTWWYQWLLFALASILAALTTNLIPIFAQPLSYWQGWVLGGLLVFFSYRKAIERQEKEVSR